MTDKQMMFYHEYVGDPELNATRAYMKVYTHVTNSATASAAASRLLNNVKGKAYVKRLMDERAERMNVTKDRVLKEYARIAFFDPRKLFNKDGSPKDITALDDDTAAVIGGLEVADIYEGFGENREFIGYLKKYKLIDKKGALDSVAKHLGMFIEKSEHKHTFENNPFKGLSTEELKKMIDGE